MGSQAPTANDIDELTAFLPRLYAPGFRPVVRWRGGEKTESGAITMPWPEYDPAVEAFFRAAANACWLDRGYSPEQAAGMIAAEGTMAAASLAEVRTMLTYCVRGERFSDGHWASMIEEGVIRALLERLKELRAESPGG
jgi:hypothetical protein